MPDLMPWPVGLARNVTPALVLVNPKFPHNVGAVVRLAAAFDAKQVIFTGNRMRDLLAELGRLPREERLRAYRHVGFERDDRPFDRFGAGVTPIAVEVLPRAESLHNFVHPTRPVYVFGPEDGGLDQVTRSHCHRFVQIPALHCLNLATAVACVLYDRTAKAGESLELAEHRGHY